MAEAAFWIARTALVVAGAAFLCYALVILVLVVASHGVGTRRTTGQGSPTQRGTSS
jgi:hypothetical protein